MSRIPQSSSNSKSRATSPRVTSHAVNSQGSTSPRLRTKSTPKPSSASKFAVSSATANKQDYSPANQPISIRDQIALKRAEAQKALRQKNTGASGLDALGSLEDALPTVPRKDDDDNILELGRWSTRETIERGRSTGFVNLSSRSLPCLPSALFEIHLGVTPEPLKSVPKEPPLPPAEPSAARRRGAAQHTPSWFEAQDLQTLKAWSNQIVEIQPEISLFGSLKVVDLHNNHLKSLPDTMADLTALTLLDVSHNSLESLPVDIFSLPNLATLNISYNSLTALHFASPFSRDSNAQHRSRPSGDGFFTPAIIRATVPLPRLVTLDASHNKITTSGIDQSPSDLPKNLSKIDLSSNPVSADRDCRSLLRALGRLDNLTELRMDDADITDASFPADLFANVPPPFPRLRVFDLGNTKLTADVVGAALRTMKQELSFDVTPNDPPQGTVRLIVGKIIVKEPWEIEAERRARLRRTKSAGEGLSSQAQKEAEDKEGKKDVVKEAWEIEAEKGLLTEGGRRRARAAAAFAAAQGPSSTPSTEQAASPVTPTHSSTLTKYYTPSTLTLTLPQSSPPARSPTHTRAISYAAPARLHSAVDRSTDITLPAPTLPLAAIAAQPFAQTLRVLVLNCRRFDRSFSLPHSMGDGRGLLPHLEELMLEGCGLVDTVPITRESEALSMSSPSRSTEPLLPLIAELFPTLRTLDLSGNQLTSASLTSASLSRLFIAEGPHRAGLRRLKLRGNRITDLDGLREVAMGFKGNRDVAGWTLEELDLSDNEIGKLLPELGLLPLDVFLVDGNTFRIPQRRVWEREGTKGLLSWLRGRMD